ncbi:calmodulin-binding protein 60 A-like [Papaver somniferum]|uniref:calmodulin-binding protein 60 A-like n=1 Tax=Papaver somniferum TaxID=3469 RepID=UPI000E703876|nr:calmodulin-binding protein 60 A-like [Papaver somniferum]
MSQKRKLEEDDNSSGSEDKRPRIPSVRNVVLEAVSTNAFQTFFTSLEPLIREVVKEEVEIALGKHLLSINDNCDKVINPPIYRNLQLKFNGKLCLPVFTGARIEGEENSLLGVVLVDAFSGNIVNSGPESLAKVEVVVLEGDFEGDEADNWTLEEFQNNIVKEREGKRPLLNGDAFFSLINGVGVVNDLIFTDNSSWTRSRKFKLGARVVDDNCDGVRIREAKSEAFMVKDHRGELYKKHHPPSLTDEVWRLEKIGKDGAFHKRLNKENIKTVKDFLTLLSLDSPKLRNILGTGMSAKMWEVTADHARTCTVDNRMYVYYPPSGQQGTGVVFNVIGHALGLFSEHQFVPLNQLSDTEKDNAQMLVKIAYENWEAVVSLDNNNIIGGSSDLPNISCPSSSIAVESSYNCDLPNSQSSVQLNDTQPSTSSSDFVSSMFPMGSTRTSDNYTWQGLDGMQDLAFEHSSSLHTQITNSVICNMEPMTPSFSSGDVLQYFDPETTVKSQDLESAVSDFIAKAASQSNAAAVGKAKTRWTMLCCVLRWRFSIRRILASKKIETEARGMSRYGKPVMPG